MSIELQQHQLPWPVFTQLSVGPVGEHVIGHLRAGQLSRRKLQLRALIGLLEAMSSPKTLRPAWSILVAADRRRPEVVDELLLHPSAGVWLARSLRRLSGAPVDSTPRTELGYLASLTGAAALRCGIRATLEVPVIHGVTTLPTVGQLELPSAFPMGKAVLEVAADGSGILRTHTGSASVKFVPPESSPGFVPVRRHTAGQLSVEIDDRGPYRTFSAPTAPQPLERLDYAEWTKLLGEAWQLLTARYPRFAAELAAGMSTLVPLESNNSFSGASSSIAFGAIAITAKYSAVDLAEALVHELQHSKLNALTDLVELLDSSFDELLYAPWRDDPRPASGLLHGVFAFLTAAEFWRVQVDGAEADGHAWLSYAYRRQQVRQTADVLLACGALTELGRIFVTSLVDRLSLVEDAVVPAQIDEAVTRMANEQQATWRLRHFRADDNWVATAAEAWQAGAQSPRLPSSPAPVAPWRRSVARSPRMELLRLSCLGQPVRRRAHSVADLAYGSGQWNVAEAAYVTIIRATPLDDQAWLGFGLTRAAGGRQNALIAAPHLVLALRDQLMRRGKDCEPVELMNWMTGPVPTD